MAGVLVMGQSGAGGRWRCRDCGSTRITGIVGAYCLGRLDRDSEHPRVSDGEFVIHMEGDVDPASIMCENCGGPNARFERSVGAEPQHTVRGRSDA